MTHHTNTDHTAVVSDEYFYQPMATCPTGQKVILLGQGGVASIGQWNGKEAFWRGWAPLPKVRKDTVKYRDLFPHDYNIPIWKEQK